MSMSAQEMIRDLRAGGEKVDVTLSKVSTVCMCLSADSRRLLTSSDTLKLHRSVRCWQLILSPCPCPCYVFRAVCAPQSMGNTCNASFSSSLRLARKLGIVVKGRACSYSQATAPATLRPRVALQPFSVGSEDENGFISC